MRASSFACSAAVVAVLAFALPAHAQINQISLFRVAQFSQTSSAAPGTTPDSYFFTARAFLDAPSDFDSGTLSYPGPASPATYTLDPNPTAPLLNFSSDLQPTQAALDAAYPTGTYTTVAHNSSTSATQTTSLSYSNPNVFPHTVPALTPASYNAIEGMHANTATSLTFTAFTPDASTTEADIFFTIFDAADNAVFDRSFLTSGTTGVTIPAGTLQANTPYTYTLIFSDRINSNGPNNVFDVLGYDNSTAGSFTTAPVPEPASLAILAAAALLLPRRRRA